MHNREADAIMLTMFIFYINRKCTNNVYSTVNTSISQDSSNKNVLENVIKQPKDARVHDLPLQP